MLLLVAGCSGPEAPSPGVLPPPRPPPHRLCEGTEELATLQAIAHGTADGCQRDKYLQMIMERGRNVGPWIEEIWVAPSPDAKQVELDKAVLVRSSAAVPEVIRHEGRTYLFYGEGDLGLGFELASEGSDWFLTRGLLGYGALGLLVSDDGVTFEPVPDFAIQDLVVGMVVDPDVIQLPDGRFRLYYVGLPIETLVDDATWNDDAQHDVYYAESDDLIHWKQLGMAVHGPIADPSVLCLTPQRCRMFSTGMDHSHSEDGGRSFVFDGATKVKGFAPEFLVEGDRLSQFYNGMIHGGPLLTRSSTDKGKTWSDPEQAVEAYKVEAPSFTRAPDGEGWLMYYHYYMEEYRDIYPARPSQDDAGEATGEPRSAAASEG